jgi:hypothetical protein
MRGDRSLGSGRDRRRVRGVDDQALLGEGRDVARETHERACLLADLWPRLQVTQNRSHGPNGAQMAGEGARVDSLDAGDAGVGEEVLQAILAQPVIGVACEIAHDECRDPRSLRFRRLELNAVVPHLRVGQDHHLTVV